MALSVSPNSLAGPVPLADLAVAALAGSPQMVLSVSPNPLGGSGGLDDGLGQPMAELLGDPAGVAMATSLAGLGGIDGLVEGLGQPIGELLVELTGMAVAEMSGRGAVSLMMDSLASLV